MHFPGLSAFRSRISNTLTRTHLAAQITFRFDASLFEEIPCPTFRLSDTMKLFHVTRPREIPPAASSIIVESGRQGDGSAAAVSVHCLQYTCPIDATHSRLIQNVTYAYFHISSDNETELLFIERIFVRSECMMD